MPMVWLEMENWLWLRAEHGLPTFNEINTQMSMYKLHCLAFYMLSSLSKIGPDFSENLVIKLEFPKNYFHKNCAPKILFFNEKKIIKIRMIFGIEN